MYSWDISCWWIPKENGNIQVCSIYSLVYLLQSDIFIPLHVSNNTITLTNFRKLNLIILCSISRHESRPFNVNRIHSENGCVVLPINFIYLHYRIDRTEKTKNFSIILHRMGENLVTKCTIYRSFNRNTSTITIKCFRNA